jgi:hypothetical protein
MEHELRLREGKRFPKTGIHARFPGQAISDHALNLAAPGFDNDCRGKYQITVKQTCTVHRPSSAQHSLAEAIAHMDEAVPSFRALDREAGHARGPRIVSRAEALRVWLRVAALSFGGPAGQIAVMHRVVEEQRLERDSAASNARIGRLVRGASLA